MNSHLGLATHVTLSIHEGKQFVLFCHYYYFPNHGVLGYVTEHIIKKFSMNRGASTWFRMFGATMWNLFIIEPYFHCIF